LNGGVKTVKEITIDSQVFKRAAVNLLLEDMIIDEQIAAHAIAVVNEGKTLTPAMIKEVVGIGKI
jgi:hypothetical protein